MRIKASRILSFGIASFALGMPVLAAASNDVTLSQLLEMAYTRHPSVLQARNQAQAAQFDVDATRWRQYPSLSTELRSDRATNPSVAKLEQPVWAAGKIPAQIDLSESNQRVADAGVQEAQVVALSRVANAFYEVLRLRDRLQSSDNNVIEHERLLALIERRAKAEVTPMADATLARARLQQAVSEQILITRQLETAQADLAEWAGPVQGELRVPKKHPLQTARQLATAARPSAGPFG